MHRARRQHRRSRLETPVPSGRGLPRAQGHSVCTLQVPAGRSTSWRKRCALRPKATLTRRRLPPPCAHTHWRCVGGRGSPHALASSQLWSDLLRMLLLPRSLPRVAWRQRCRRSAGGTGGSGRHIGCDTPHGVQRTQRHGCQHAVACSMLALTVAMLLKCFEIGSMLRFGSCAAGGLGWFWFVNPSW